MKTHLDELLEAMGNPSSDPRMKTIVTIMSRELKLPRNKVMDELPVDPPEHEIDAMSVLLDQWIEKHAETGDSSPGLLDPELYAQVPAFHDMLGELIGRDALQRMLDTVENPTGFEQHREPGEVDADAFGQTDRREVSSPLIMWLGTALAIVHNDGDMSHQARRTAAQASGEGWYDEDEPEPEEDVQARFDEILALIADKGWRTANVGGYYDMSVYDPRHWRTMTTEALQRLKPHEAIHAVEGGGLGSADSWLFPNSPHARALTEHAIRTSFLSRQPGYQRVPDENEPGGVRYDWAADVHDPLYRDRASFMRSFRSLITGQRIGGVEAGYTYHLSSGNIFRAFAEIHGEGAAELIERDLLSTGRKTDRPHRIKHNPTLRDWDIRDI